MSLQRENKVVLACLPQWSKTAGHSPRPRIPSVNPDPRIGFLFGSHLTSPFTTSSSPSTEGCEEEGDCSGGCGPGAWFEILEFNK